MSYTPSIWVAGDSMSSTRLNNIEQGIGVIDVSYTPFNWGPGDVVTANRMNHIEQGIKTIHNEMDANSLPIKIAKLYIDGCTIPERATVPITDVNSQIYANFMIYRNNDPDGYLTIDANYVYPTNGIIPLIYIDDDNYHTEIGFHTSPSMTVSYSGDGLTYYGGNSSNISNGEVHVTVNFTYMNSGEVVK